MKQVIAGVCIFVLAVGHAWAAEDDERVAASRATVKEFMQSLKGELQKGMQDGGPVNAIGVCNMTAHGIANTYSVRNDWTVGRTSLKVRNPDNAPDTWEQAVLQEFERRKHAGEDLHQGRFAGARATDEPDLLTGADIEAEAIEHRLVRLVGKLQLAEFDASLAGLQRPRVRGVFHGLVDRFAHLFGGPVIILAGDEACCRA